MTDTSPPVPADEETTPSDSTVLSTESPAPFAAPSEPVTVDTEAADPAIVPDVVSQRVVAGIDSSVEQGNRVTVVDPITRTNPLEPILTKIENHFSNAAHIVNDLRALADELETLLNTLKAGS